MTGRTGGTDESATTRRRRPVVVAALVAASAVMLSACASTVDGTASKDPDAQPWVLPLGDDDLPDVLLNADDLAAAVGASELDMFGEDTVLADTSASVTNQDCLGAFNAGEETVYEGSDYASAQMSMATEPDAGETKAFWVQQVVVLFPSEVESEAFFAESTDEWENCNQTRLETLKDDNSTYEWRLDDVVVEDSSLSQFAEQTDAAEPWGCDHTMSVVSNVIVEAVTCTADGPGSGADLNAALVENATLH